MTQEFLIIATGLVQGVSFRALVAGRAKLYGLCGYVKNLPNQNVEICIQGSKNLVDDFLESLKKDSGQAKINELSLQTREAEQLFDCFVILY